MFRLTVHMARIAADSHEQFTKLARSGPKRPPLTCSITNTPPAVVVTKNRSTPLTLTRLVSTSPAATRLPSASCQTNENLAPQRTQASRCCNAKPSHHGGILQDGSIHALHTCSTQPHVPNRNACDVGSRGGDRAARFGGVWRSSKHDNCHEGPQRYPP